MGDLNYFALDWNQAGEVLGAVVVLSIFLERFLSVIFENEWYRQRLKDRHIKEPIALACALVLCVTFRFDAVAIIMKHQTWSAIGLLLTAGVIAGGSKASIKLFIDVMKVRNLSPEEEEQETELRRSQRDKKIRDVAVDATKRAKSKRKASKKKKAGGSR